MDTLAAGQILVHVGIAAMSVSAIGAVIAIPLFGISGKRLRKQLEQEFGKERR